MAVGRRGPLPVVVGGATSVRARARCSSAVRRPSELGDRRRRRRRVGSSERRHVVDRQPEFVEHLRPTDRSRVRPRREPPPRSPEPARSARSTSSVAATPGTRSNRAARRCAGSSTSGFGLARGAGSAWRSGVPSMIADEFDCSTPRTLTWRGSSASVAMPAASGLAAELAVTPERRLRLRSAAPNTVAAPRGIAHRVDQQGAVVECGDGRPAAGRRSPVSRVGDRSA